MKRLLSLRSLFDCMTFYYRLTTAPPIFFPSKSDFVRQTIDISPAFIFLRMSLIFLISLALDETGNPKRLPSKKSVSAKA